MTTPAVEAIDVTRSYELEGGVRVDALRGVSLRIDQGEYVAIIGPSGSGKSTLMHLLGCLDRPTTGQLRIDGRDIAVLDDTDLARLRNETVGFVFQSFQLLPRISATANVALPLVYRGVSRAERTERAHRALTAVGLQHRLDHRPTQLSGGEQQRVAIARALVSEPTLLLADEPTGNLDGTNAAQVFDLMLEMNQEAGSSLVIVTHDEGLAARMDRRVVLRGGRLLAEGT